MPYIHETPRVSLERQKECNFHEDVLYLTRHGRHMSHRFHAHIFVWIRENAYTRITKQKCPNTKRLYIITTTACAQYTQWNTARGHLMMWREATRQRRTHRNLLQKYQTEIRGHIKDPYDHFCVIKLSVGKFCSTKTLKVSKETVSKSRTDDQRLPSPWLRQKFQPKSSIITHFASLLQSDCLFYNKNFNKSIFLKLQKKLE